MRHLIEGGKASSSSVSAITDQSAACPSSPWNSVSMNLRTYTAALFASVGFFGAL
jgi:hypothetical protein